MADKRGSWSQEDLKLIWDDYVSNKIWTIWPKHHENLKTWNLQQKAPCRMCGEEMIRAQYKGLQPQVKTRWDIDHHDGNFNNNQLSNFQPMHSSCNVKKGNK